MPDPYLEAMMHGNYLPSKKIKNSEIPQKNKFASDAEKHIDSYIGSLNLEVQYAQNKLISPAEKQAEIKREMLKALNFKELEDYLSTALKFLVTKGNLYQSTELQQEMLEQIKQAGQVLNTMDESDNIQKVLKLSDSVLNSVFNIAISLYVEQDYLNSLAIFVFLSFLHPENDDYWYRLGIAAQKSKNTELALKSYAVALELNPKNIGARLFSVECYLNLEDLKMAKTQLTEAKKITETEKVDSQWLDFMNYIENLLNRPLA